MQLTFSLIWYNLNKMGVILTVNRFNNSMFIIAYLKAQNWSVYIYF